MAFYVWKPETTSSALAYYFSEADEFSAQDDLVSFAYATTGNYNGGVGPWSTTLYEGSYNFFGVTIVGPAAAASYVVPATDANTNAVFTYKYESVHLSPTETGLFFTESANGSYGPLDQEVLYFQPYNASGSAAAGGAIQLALNGTSGAVTDLYDSGIGVNASFGNGFMVIYSTFDPSSKATTIHYETFNDAGVAQTGGQIAGFNDGTHHGITTGTFYAYNDTSFTPAYVVIYRLPVATTAGVQVDLLNTDGSARGSFQIDVFGPGKIPTSDVYAYGFGDESPTDPLGKYSIFTQTFGYTTTSGTTTTSHVGIDVETYVSSTQNNGSTLTPVASTEFQDVNNSETGVGVARVLDGDFVIAYSDGKQTYLREYNESLALLATYTVPDDNYGFEDLTSLGDGRVLLSWRQSVGSSYVQHSEILDTRTPGETITPAAGTLEVAGTTGNDVINHIAGNETINGGGGVDVYSAKAFTLAQVTISVDASNEVVLVAPDGTDILQAFTTITLSDVSIAVAGNVLTTTYADGSTSVAKYNITGQSFTSSVKNFDAAGNLDSVDYNGVTGQAYTAFEYDYDGKTSGGAYNIVGSKFFYAGANGAPIEIDYDAANALAAAFYAGGVNSFSKLEIDYVSGALADRRYDYVGPGGSSYVADTTLFNFANAYEGAIFQYDHSAQGYQQYVATGPSGALTGSENDYADISGQPYTSTSYDLNAGGALIAATYSGYSGATPYSSVEQIYSGGALAHSEFTYDHDNGLAYYKNTVIEDASGNLQFQVFDFTTGVNRLIGSGSNETSPLLGGVATEANATPYSEAGGDWKITGGTGHTNDTFVFAPIFNTATITDFNIGAGTHDVISFSSADFASAGAALGSAMQSGSGTIITSSATHDQLTLAGVLPGQLSAADFSIHS